MNNLLTNLRQIVGNKHVLIDQYSKADFCHGYRTGYGDVIAVVCPGNLWEMWLVLEQVIAADCVIIMQAANTGLTGGSTPNGDNYDRPVVLINTMRINKIQIIKNGAQVICLPGATLDKLEQKLKPLGREPHSVIGSSCIGASVLGGICNNSGGALVRRGPAYTELSVYAKVNPDGKLELVNNLGVNLGLTAQEILTNLDHGNYSTDEILDTNARASYDRYAEEVTDINADSPARFNANPNLLYDSSGSAGKICVFAVRLDTFKIEPSKVIYIGSNNPNDLTAIRRFVLTNLPSLPIAGEYIHRTAFDIGEKYGKDTFIIINLLGTKFIPHLFKLKNLCDRLLSKLGGSNLSDKVLQLITNVLPKHLPKKLYEYRNLYEHHLMLKVAEDSFKPALEFLHNFFADNPSGDCFECSTEEGQKAFLHRFAVASAAIRYAAVHKSQIEDILALDIALRRNDLNWVEQLPSHIDEQIVHKLYYGHFLCHVFHQDYLLKKETNINTIKEQMLQLLDNRRAEYPAEHNVGHLYKAKPKLAKFYQYLDPTNSFNPGIGKTSAYKNWQNEPCNCTR